MSIADESGFATARTLNLSPGSKFIGLSIVNVLFTGISVPFAT